MNIPHVTIFTHIPSPYQVEFFDALSADSRIALRIVYVERSCDSRGWSVPPLENQTYTALSDGRVAEATAAEWAHGADLTVFSWYCDRRIRRLIEQREKSHNPWCYWGERPGFSQWKFLSHLRRKQLLKPLFRSRAPVWGIGNWAVAAWRSELGDRRQYFNIPYFSDLSRFFRRSIQTPRELGIRRILFSGSLIYRKGIDLLARAFAQVARESPQLRLDILGSGKLKSSISSTLRDCANQVRFLGFRQWSELPEIYQAADVLCAPSRYDGWGMIIPEGLAAGLPVISTDRMGAAMDLVQDEVNGWKLAAGHQDDLERALRTVANLTDSQLDAMSRAATSSAVQHSLQGGVDRFCEVVTGTLATFS